MRSLTEIKNDPDVRAAWAAVQRAQGEYSQAVARAVEVEVSSRPVITITNADVVRVLEYLADQMSENPEGHRFDDLVDLQRAKLVVKRCPETFFEPTGEAPNDTGELPRAVHEPMCWVSPFVASKINEARLEGASHVQVGIVRVDRSDDFYMVPLYADKRSAK